MYVFGELSRVFNFPSGPHNYGRLLYLAQKHTDKDKLLNIKEFNGFSDAIAAIGLSVGPAECDGKVPPTLASSGWVKMPRVKSTRWATSAGPPSAPKVWS
jgi:hypothetical protein